MESPDGGSGQGATRPVDHLTDVLSGLDLSGTSLHQKKAQEMATPASQARPRARPRQDDDKENAGTSNDTDGVTPSRLTCFKQLRDELTCAVCLEICVRPCTTPCGHNYCRSCLRRTLELNRPCPKCRASLPPGFTLSINTTLWNTIQHLFPSEAAGKPLTPPPPQQQQPHAAARRPGSGASGANNPAAAPFRPPRFLGGDSAAHAPFTGLSSSRANTAATSSATTSTLLAGGGMGLASFYGRSVSGPRPQRSMHPTALGNDRSGVAAQPQGLLAQAASAAQSGLVELGMAAPPQARSSRGGGGGRPPAGTAGAAAAGAAAQSSAAAAAAAAASRRARRRSRSAERWEGELWPLAGAGTGDVNADFGASAAPSRGVSARVAAAGLQPPSLLQPASSSRLMELLADGGTAGTRGASAAFAGSRAPHALPHNSARNAPAQPSAGAGAPVAGAGMNSNPFMRALRPVQTRAPAAGATQAGTQQAARNPHANVAAGSAAAAAATAAAASTAIGGAFTASQRAHIGARTQLAVPSAAASLNATTAGGASLQRPANANGSSDERPASSSSSSSYFIDSSSPGSNASGGGASSPGNSNSSIPDSPVAGPLDDVSALELLPDDQHPPRLPRQEQQQQQHPSRLPRHPPAPPQAWGRSNSLVGAGAGAGANVSAPDLGRRPTGFTDVGEDQAVRVAMGRRSDTGYAAGRDQGAAARPSAMASSSAGAVPAMMAPAALPTAAGRRTRLEEDIDLDEEISLEGLDVLSPAGPELGLRTAQGVSYAAEALNGGEGGAEPAAPSPTWEELDRRMAAALQPVVVSPPSLPRLRIHTRPDSPPSAAAPAPTAAPVQHGGLNQHAADLNSRKPALAGPHSVEGSLGVAVAYSIGAGATSTAQGLLGAFGGDDRGIGSPPDSLGRHMDPDSPSNYEGEDPAGRDSFFTSPFFDRSMLRDGASHGDQDGHESNDDDVDDEDEEEVVEEGGRGGANGLADQPRQLESAFALLGLGQDDDEEQGTCPRIAHQPAASSRQHVQGAVQQRPVTRSMSHQQPQRPLHSAAAAPAAASGGLFPSGTGAAGRAAGGAATSRGQPLQVRTSTTAAATGATRQGLRQAGDRNCPIELLSDSDNEDDVGMGRGVAGAEDVDQDVPQESSVSGPVLRTSRRVVSGLRRPRRG
ncbi:hypothetical protein Agub_g6944 [Astrephomene gubernaculifera]|uniref:RING-type E3 ubiquitin transferase n=1 Tax=Astrephomene gubernaculifera TaxID=47775 RepID=A0AAD3DPC0_9CHLO|nr:hypothetical protein Agub_g6944 [Astrephomene gubernaculifera]